MKNPLAYLKGIFGVELKSGFGKYNLVISLIGLILAFAFLAYVASPISSIQGLGIILLTIVSVLYMGLKSFERIGEHEERTRHHKKQKRKYIS